MLKCFWDWPSPPPPPPHLEDDADGRAGIWKAPLPDGTAELKRKPDRWGQSKNIFLPKIIIFVDDVSYLSEFSETGVSETLSVVGQPQLLPDLRGPVQTKIQQRNKSNTIKQSNTSRRLCVLTNTKLYHQNLLLWIFTKFTFLAPLRIFF